MSAKLKSSFKSWMFVYIAFAVSLWSSGTAAESTPTSVSPEAPAAELAAERTFFTPIVPRIRRLDI